MGIIARDIGIDLGTCNTQLYVQNKGIMVNEPSITLVETNDQHKVEAVGTDSRILLGRTDRECMLARPMQEGVIVDFDLTALMLEHFIHKAIGSSFLIRPRLFVSYPSSISAIERRAVGEVAHFAGGRKVFLVEKPFLAALGSGLPVFEPTGSMVVDIGGGTTDVAVVSLGGVVSSHSIRVGGSKIDEAIATYIRREFDIGIGERTAEEIKLDLGAALPLQGERRARIRGKNVVTTLPETAEVSSTHIYQAIRETCQAIVRAIKWVLERTPPELASDVVHNGIHLTGGGSLLYGMDQMIASELGIRVLPAREPMDSAALGLGYVIENFDLLQHLGRTSFLLEA